MKRFCFLMVFCIASCAHAQDKATDNVVVILDNSGSMSERMDDGQNSKMDAAKTALVKVLGQVPKTAHVGILVLNTDWGEKDCWLYPIGPVDMPSITQKVMECRNGGGTPLGSRLKDGADALLGIRNKQHYGSYRLLIVTDGEATDPGTLDKTFPDAISRGLVIDVIGVKMSQDHALATKARSYRKADDPASLEAAIQQVMAEVPSTGDASNSSEDFELAAAIPDEMALKLIQTICASGNEPIGEKKPLVFSDDGKLVPPPAKSGSGWYWFWGFFGGVCGLVVIAIVFRFFCDEVW